MAIFNSYVSLPEGTSGDISDGKISTPKPKNVICFEGWTNVLLVKKKNKYLHSAGGHLDFFKRNILIFGSTTVIFPLLVDGIPRFLYPVPSRAYTHLSHPFSYFKG